MHDPDADDMPDGMSWEEYLYMWEVLNTPPTEVQHEPFPDSPTDPEEPPF